MRTYINLLLTILIGALWHGTGLVIHKIWRVHKGWNASHGPLADILCTTGSFAFVAAGLMFFLTESMAGALLIFRQILFWQPSVRRLHFWTLVACIACLAQMTASRWIARRRLQPDAKPGLHAVYLVADLRFGSLVLFLVLCGLILCLAYTGNHSFIYGNF